jgi:hypothetical protein
MNFDCPRGTNCGGVQNRTKVIFFLLSKRNFSIVLFKIYKIYLIKHTTCKFNNEITKTAQGNSHRKFMKKLLINSPVLERKKQIFLKFKCTL